MSAEIVQVPKDIPLHALSPAVARTMNADALAGISTGFPASIRIKGSKFRIVDGNGEEVVLKANELKNSEFLDIAILAAKPGLNKIFYAAAYDPNQTEALAPDCFSLDGAAPDPSVAKPQNPACAACPKNAFGSGRNASGQATKGKACSDNKILAVFRGGKVYSFKIPPASLKNFGIYVKNLTTRGVPLGNVITYVGFSDAVDFPVLEFRVGAFIPETAKEQLAIVAADQEVADIVRPLAFNPGPSTTTSAPTPTTPSITPPVVAAAAAATVETPKRGKPKATEAPATAVLTDEEITKALGL